MTEQFPSQKKKMPRPPPGPPDWVEGPQIPTKEELAYLDRVKQAKQALTQDALEQVACAGVLLIPALHDLDEPYLGEHLPGRHDQSTHGRSRGGQGETPKSATQGTAKADKAPKAPKAAAKTTTKTTTPKVEPPKEEPKKGEPPKAPEPPKEEPKPEPPKAEPPPEPEIPTTPMNDHLYGPQASRNEFDTSYGKDIAAFASQRGMSVDEYQQACQQHMEHLMQGAGVWTRVSGANLGKILADGRFKSQFEAGVNASSGSIMNNRIRAEGEQEMFGYGAGTSPTERPIYGYLSSHPDGITDNGYGGYTLDSYGGLAVQFHDSVASQTSYTYGDSLSPYGHLCPAPVTHPSYRAAQTGYDLLARQSVNSGSQCFEAHIHGGAASARSIKQVIFYSGGSAKPPSATVLKRLQSMGIPYRVVKRS